MQESDESLKSNLEPYEDTVNSIPDFLRGLSKRRESATTALKKKVTKRRQTIFTLIQLAVFLHQHHRNSHIATATGAGVGTASFGLVLGGFIAAFFTAGAGLIVSAVGAGLGAAGGLTMTVSKLAEYILSKQGLQEVQRVLDEDREASKSLKRSFERVDQFIACNSAFITRNMTNPRLIECFGIRNAPEMFPSGTESPGNEQRQDRDIRDTAARLLRTLGAGFTVSASAATASVSAGRAVFNTMTIAARAAHIAGFAASAALLPVDIYFLVKSSVELHKGSTSEAFKQVEKILDELLSSSPREEEVQELVPQYVGAKFFEIVCDHAQPAPPETED